MLRSCLPQLLITLTLMVMSMQGGMANIDEKVCKAMVTLRTISDVVTISSQPTGKVSTEPVLRFLTSFCACRKAGGKSCNTQFSTEYITIVRASCCKLSHGELDLAIMGEFMAGVNTSKHGPPKKFWTRSHAQYLKSRDFG